jgi:membrane protein
MDSLADAQSKHTVTSGILRMTRELPVLLADSGRRWVSDACYRLGASLSYFAVFSMFPLVLLSLSALGFSLRGDDTVRQRLLGSVAGTSPELRALLDQTLASLQAHSMAGSVGAAVGLLALLVGASGVFSELEFALNTVWKVESKGAESLEANVVDAVRSKALSFAIVAVVAVALLVSVAIGTALQAARGEATQGGAARGMWQAVEFVASVALLTGLFALVYRVVPQAEVAWRDATGGAFVSSLLLATLKGLIAWYLAHVGRYAAYGAVGGVLVLLAWIYVASLVVLYGAEFSRVCAESHGTVIPVARRFDG